MSHLRSSWPSSASHRITSSRHDSHRIPSYRSRSAFARAYTRWSRPIGPVPRHYPISQVYFLSCSSSGNLRRVESRFLFLQLYRLRLPQNDSEARCIHMYHTALCCRTVYVLLDIPRN
ncbi:hypothetical protein EXIGLDRAFT_723463 [Exidia glandulosa HHB12029]|uniref:Uncharacterized protein n=1 Tax=Exidia glandulosa HHB12029 TaxID=1314781 RepID=A0A165EF56_EXIGL|nr:hypothetical protein EXIGLDRAFT_725111 [Exidia glandulosa HHB12029]KZV86791.1 hypothetical protein EXIGLDRAFT_724425 [Exidia glandulosa HHB12029]KZV87706.1 hypothetical protein EXIGLDRAFT_723463 [Exidia glandulosa HHB12029]